MCADGSGYFPLGVLSANPKIVGLKPVTLIGTGNVAWQLGTAFRQVGVPIAEVYGRDAAKSLELAQHLGARSVNNWQDLSVSDGMVVLCVKDDAIAEVAASFLNTPRLLVHTSGTVSMHILDGKAEHIGVFYPLQSLHRNRPVNWFEIPLCLEASSSEFLDELTLLASGLSNKVIYLSSEQRRWLHLAAVIVSNFTNFLYIQAESLCHEHGLSFQLLQPLIMETARRLEISSPSNWQTGPARRNDVQVMNLHIQLLKDKPELQQLYREFSECVMRYYYTENKK
jgi:predicted short-subunit dehydrogenase-like oxidoreductase (DUF2520 family)